MNHSNTSVFRFFFPFFGLRTSVSGLLSPFSSLRTSVSGLLFSFSGLRTSVSGLLLLSLLLTSCKDIRKDYYPNGKLKQELSYKNGVQEGPAVWYFENGAKMMECTYKAGKIEGTVKRWFFTGIPQNQTNYTNNQKEGRSIQNYENGAIQLVQNYKNDTLDGAFVEYYPDKQIKSRGVYSMGLWQGKWEYYDDKGILVGEGNFVKGSGILKGYYWNGRLKREVHYLNNQKDGIETWYNEKGLFEKELVYKQDKQVSAPDQK